MANLISYFEQNREIIGLLWQHPNRLRAAAPAKDRVGAVNAMADFKGNWDDLAETLFDARYFNCGVGRKACYMQLNATGLLEPVLPSSYIDRAVDIKNPDKKWQPSFKNTPDRIEMRLFDAPTDEYIAALQIKYTRALLDRTWNKDVEVKDVASFQDRAALVEKYRERPGLFLNDAEAHFKDLGLDPKEFEPLVVQSASMLTFEPKAKADPKEYKHFRKATEEEVSEKISM